MGGSVYRGSTVISVPMILVGQHALNSIRKLVHLPNNVLSYEGVRTVGTTAKSQQQSKSLKVKDLMYDDSLSFGWVK